jgi:hypothetical protein
LSNEQLVHQVLPRCDICGWEHWLETKQEAWHDVDYDYTEHKDNLANMMRGMLHARILHRMGRVDEWKEVTIEGFGLLGDAPVWVVRADDFPYDSSIVYGYAGWRLAGSQRVFCGPFRRFEFESERDAFKRKVEAGYRRALAGVCVSLRRSALFANASLVGLLLEYLVWHDKDRHVPNKLFGAATQ